MKYYIIKAGRMLRIEKLTLVTKLAIAMFDTSFIEST